MTISISSRSNANTASPECTELNKWQYKNAGLTIYSCGNSLFVGFLQIKGLLRTNTLSFPLQDLPFKSVQEADEYFRKNIPQVTWKWHLHWLIPYKKFEIHFLENPIIQIHVLINGKSVSLDMAAYDTVHKIKHRLRKCLERKGLTKEKGYSFCQLTYMGKPLEDGKYIKDSIESSKSNIHALYFNGGCARSEMCNKCVTYFSSK